jgi:glycosyltransferase involved in cell wall biosynthesis
MKIVYILPTYWPAIGGCEIHTRALAGMLAKRHRIKIVTLINSQKEKGRSPNLWKTAALYASAKASTYRDGEIAVKKISTTPMEKMLIYPLLRSKKVYTKIEPFAMSVLALIFRRKLKALVSGSSVIHSIFGGLSYLSYSAMQIAKTEGIPFVFTPLLHLYDPSWEDKKKGNDTVQHHVAHEPKLEMLPMEYHDRYWVETCRESDALITMTEYEKNFFTHWLTVREDKTYAVGVGPVLAAQADVRKVREKYAIAPHQKMVLFVGRNHPLKGIEELCAAAEEVWCTHPEVRFFFAGPKEGSSRESFDRCKDPRITAIGEVTTAEKTNLIAACDIFCLPSMHESFGGVFLEAWHFEKPIIGCDIPPVRELNEGEKGGFLVDPVPHEIANRIIRLVENPELARTMGRWGRQRVIERYNWNWIADRMEKIYRSLVDSK